MLIETDRFGSFDTKDSKLINFPQGLRDLRSFTILSYLKCRKQSRYTGCNRRKTNISRCR